MIEAAAAAASVPRSGAMVDCMKELRAEITALKANTGLSTGVVIAYNGPPSSGSNNCPVGFSQVSGASGRFIIGAGGSFSLGQTGGSSTRTLSVSNLPAHRHRVSVSTKSGQNDFLAGSSLNSGIDTTFVSGNTKHAVTERIGSGSSFNITPPFIAMWLCRKN
ncbi:MAG: hypothetical protein AAF441_16545 [Pseudomonadota bacterium]